jgi:hypothetical protein
MNTLRLLKTIKTNTMKKNYLMIFVAVLVLYSCHSATNETVAKVSFGIYEMVKVNEIPAAITDALKSMGVVMDSSHRGSPLGYLPEADSMVALPNVARHNMKLIRSHYPVGYENRYYEIVAVRPVPVIDNSHILKSNAKGDQVIIHLNYKGAKKLADLSRNNIGNRIAFIIDNQTYCLPVVMGEINEGSAIINGLPDANDARKISASLNASRTE